VLYFDFIEVMVNGISKEISFFNTESFPLFIGTAIYAYEGISLILPIADSMKEPEKFGSVLATCILSIGSVFTIIGISGYMTFGDSVGTIIFLNLPKNSPIVILLQFAYALAIILSFPLTVYPTIRITEQGNFTFCNLHAGIFGHHTGKSSPLIKWQKNIYRTFVILFVTILSYSGADNLDKIVSLVGCFACIPLCFIYPAIFHYNIAQSKASRNSDMAVAVLGVIAMIYTTTITMYQWMNGSKDIPIDRCKQ
jgi:proton-coupled amino acid transporter